MKKIGLAILIFSLIITLPAVAFAAAKAGTLGVGMYFGGLPTLKYNFTKEFAGEAGIGLSSTSGGGTSQTTFTLLARGDYIVISKENLNGYAGGALTYMSYPVGAGTASSFTLQGQIGVEGYILPSLSLSIDLVPLSFTSTSVGGTTTTTFNLLSGTSIIVTSFHYYF